MLVMDKVIKRLRMKKGITQSTLAKSVGVKQSTISRIENSCYNPSIELITKILLFLIIS